MMSGDIFDPDEKLATENELESEPPTDAKGNKEEGNGKKRGRPVGSKNKRKEVTKASTRKLEDLVGVFGRRDRVRRSPVINREGGFKAGIEEQICTIGVGKEREELMNENRENGGKEEKAERGGVQSEEKEEGQKEILEFLKSQSRSMEENLRMKEEMMEGIKVENTSTREFLTSEISKIKKELKHKEEEWQIERKIMQVRIETLEDKVTALETKIEDEKIETQIRSEVEKRLNEEEIGIPEA